MQKYIHVCVVAMCMESNMDKKNKPTIECILLGAWTAWEAKTYWIE